MSIIFFYLVIELEKDVKRKCKDKNENQFNNNQKTVYKTKMQIN